MLKNSMDIHPTAVVNSKAEIGPGVRIGPYSSVGKHAKIGRDTEIAAHVIVDDYAEIGERNRIYPFASIGSPPQDIGYNGENTRLIMGDDNLVREYVSLNRATTKEKWQTVIGNHCYFMAYSHVAHDCRISDHVILTNGATLGGHARIGEYAILGAFIAVQQFVRIGSHAFVGAMTGIDRDVPPFMITGGGRGKLYGVNQKGLARRGFTRETIAILKKAYSIIWRKNKSFKNGIPQVKKELDLIPELQLLLDFLESSERGVLR